jgi:hypothetical protein
MSFRKRSNSTDGMYSSTAIAACTCTSPCGVWAGGWVQGGGEEARVQYFNSMRARTITHEEPGDEAVVGDVVRPRH